MEKLISDYLNVTFGIVILQLKKKKGMIFKKRLFSSEYFGCYK